MTAAFEYRPKYVDIRVRKPTDEAPRHAPQERSCDHVGCTHPGAHRAPKSREQSNEYWWFCLEHATDYNRRWNYFSGMSDAELASFQKDAETGHRPTWTFRSGRLDRNSAAMRSFQAGRRGDPFGMFNSDGAAVAEARPRRRLTRLQALSLEVLSLDEAADGAAIRARYAELVKRWHPDSNGGDRGAEAQLQRVVHAYQTLKAGGLV
ncbi:MAG: DnaJ domain-containing protein [Pseudomonadota bacterium]